MKGKGRSVSMIVSMYSSFLTGLDHHVILLSLIEVGNKVLDGCIVVHVDCDGLVHVIRALDLIPSFETCGG